MKAEDKADLERPYDTPSHPRIEGRFAECIGAAVPTFRSLGDEIAKDFDPTLYGIGWWAPHPGTARRILISDYLLQVVDAVEINLVEAELHFREWRDCSTKADNRALEVRGRDANGQPLIKCRPMLRAADDLPRRLAALHLVGLVRAIGSTLDCVGASAVGVLGLNTSIVKADMQKTLSVLKDLRAHDDGTKFQKSFEATFETAVAEAGPRGWLGWASDLRNTYVHRARRLSIQSVVEVDKGVPGLVPHLPSEPDLSDIEALKHDAGFPVLGESAHETVPGLIGSVRAFSERIGEALLKAWRHRRENPALVAQPRKQWDAGLRSAKGVFTGYSVANPIDANAAAAHPFLTKRIATAALDEHGILKWPSFD